MKTEDIFTCTMLTPSKAETENCLAIGTRLADFEITGILGEGGFGIVYVAFDHSLQRTVAIKEYMPSSLAGRGADGSITARSKRHKETFNAGLRSFINEARLLAQFDHPSLVKVYRFWEENKTAYMAMRYYEGHTLKNIINDNPKIITEAWLRFIFKQILEALDVLYKMKILHRDISPDNIIIQKNGSAVLLDFGAARQIIGDMAQGLTVILKPGYAPIEQYADDSAMKQGPWTDIYSLSAVMYFAITKTPPPSSVARMVSDPITSLKAGAHSGFSPKFLAAVDTGMSVQPENRPQSIAEFRKLLNIGAFMSQAPAMSSTSSGDGTKRRLSKAEDSANVDRKENAISSSAGKSTQISKIKRSTFLAAFVIFFGAVLVFMLYSSNQPTNQIATTSPAIKPQKTAPDMQALSSLPKANPPVDKESIAWDLLSNNKNATLEEISAFILKYPASKHIQQANLLLAEIKSKTSANVKKTPAHIPETTVIAPTQATPEAPATSAVVKLAIKPWGTIFIDGKQKGVTPPLKKITLAIGKHKIKVVNPNFPDYLSEIDVSNKTLLSITYDFSAPVSKPNPPQPSR